MLNCFEDFEKAFTITSAQKDDFIKNVFFETEMTRRIKSAEWDPAYSEIRFTANTSQLSHSGILANLKKSLTIEEPKNFTDKLWKYGEDFFSEINGKQELEFVSVKVEVVGIEWLGNEVDKFLNFMSDGEVE